MKISVTEKHIQNGCKHSCGGCPIALALRDSGHLQAQVGVQSWWVHPSSIDIVALPEEAVQFIEHFDLGLSVAPFEFETEVPDGN